MPVVFYIKVDSPRFASIGHFLRVRLNNVPRVSVPHIGVLINSIKGLEYLPANQHIIHINMHNYIPGGAQHSAPVVSRHGGSKISAIPHYDYLILKLHVTGTQVLVNFGSGIVGGVVIYCHYVIVRVVLLLDGLQEGLVPVAGGDLVPC